MRIAVLNNAAPFVRGGAEHLADSLVEQLRAHGHEAELYRTLLRFDTPQQVQESMMAARLWRLNGADRVIALKFPAYLVPHKDKVLWLLHQFRQVYDLWDERKAADPQWVALQRAIRTADATALAESHRVFCNADTTRDRLQRFNGAEATVLHPPLGDTSLLRCDDYGDYVFAPGRLNGHKRQHLVVEAMAHVTSDVRLVVAGPPDGAADVARLEATITRHGLQDRVLLEPEFITEQRKADLIAGALAVAYCPLDEDSYGYVTLEAHLSSTPVVTTTDSGGILQMVHDGRTGLVTPPDPRQLAEAFDALRDDPARAKAMGEAALEAAVAMDLTWERVVAALTS
jgi:glycosyltransferase involved in cell wall biosynthesis